MAKNLQQAAREMERALRRARQEQDRVNRENRRRANDYNRKVQQHNQRVVDAVNQHNRDVVRYNRQVAAGERSEPPGRCPQQGGCERGKRAISENRSVHSVRAALG